MKAPWKPSSYRSLCAGAFVCHVKLELLCMGAKAEVALNKDVTLSAHRILGSLSLGAVYLLKGGVFVRWIQSGGGGDFWSP